MSLGKELKGYSYNEILKKRVQYRPVLDETNGCKNVSAGKILIYTKISTNVRIINNLKILS